MKPIPHIQQRKVGAGEPLRQVRVATTEVCCYAQTLRTRHAWVAHFDISISVSGHSSDSKQNQPNASANA